MATHTIRIVVATTGATGTVRQLNQVSSSANRLNTSLGFLRTALAVGFAAGAVREFAQLSDSFTKLQTRTRVFAKSNAEAATAQRALLDISTRSRSSIEATSELYQRLSQSLGRVGASQGEVLSITETLTKAIAIGGATTAEAEGGLRQLSQAFAANRLSGQELNSVLEQLPVVAQLIADELGVAVGDLRRVSREGVITADVMRRAFSRGGTGIEEAFNKVKVTFGQAFEVIKTVAIETAGVLGEAFGVSDLPKQIAELALSFQTLLRDKDKIRAFAEEVKAALFGIATAVGVLAAALLALNFNPVVLAVTALVAAIAYLSAEMFKLRNVIFEIPGFEGVFTLNDIVIQSWEWLVELASDALTTIKAILDLDLDQLTGAGIGQRINNMIYGSSGNTSAQAALQGPARDLVTGDVLLNEFGGAGVQNLPAQTPAQARTSRILERERQRQEALAQSRMFDVSDTLGSATVTSSLDKVADPAADKAREDARKAFDRLTSDFSEGTKLGLEYAKNLKTVEEALKTGAVNADEAADATAELTKRFTEQARELDKSGELLNAYRDSLESLEQTYDPEIAALDEIADRQNTLNELRREATRIGDQEGLRRIQRIEDLAKERDALEEARRIDPNSTGLGALNEGFKASLSELGDAIGSEGEIIKEGFSNIFSDVGDAFRQFTETGKLNIRDLASTILSEISGAIAKMLVLQALQATSSTFGGSGGFLGAIGGIAGTIAGGAKAQGGDVMAGRSYIVGENGPERFTAPTDGAIVPGAGGNISISMNITTKDADSFRASKGQIESEMAGALARARQRNG